MCCAGLMSAPWKMEAPPGTGLAAPEKRFIHDEGLVIPKLFSKGIARDTPEAESGAAKKGHSFR